MYAEAAVVACAGEADEEAEFGGGPSGGREGGLDGLLVGGRDGCNREEAEGERGREEVLWGGGGAVGAEGVGGKLLEGEELREREK